MKFKKEHGIIIGFVAVLLVPSIAGIFVHNDYSVEKKTPASFPTSFSDDFLQKVNSWYDDHSPFRTGMINIHDGIFKGLNDGFRKWLIDLNIKNSGFDHVHKFSEWEIVTPATEENSGLKTRSCEVCGKVEEEIIPKLPHVHTFSTEWSYDEHEHWHAATCAHTSLREDNAPHVYDEGIMGDDGIVYATCTVCGYVGTPEQEGGEHIHIYSSNWSSDDQYHWHNAICEHKDLKKDVEEHSYSGWHVHDEINGIRAKTCSVCNHDLTQDVSNKLERTIDTTEYPYYPYVEANKDVLYGRDNWLYYLGDSSMEYYKGTNVLNENDRNIAVGKLQALQDVCNSKGIQLVFTMFPNKDHVYPEFMPTVEGKINALTRAQQLNNYIQLNTDLNFTYPLDALIEGKKEHDTYLKQDSHWNEFGGAIAAREIYSRLNWEFKGIEVEEINHNGGDLVAIAKTTAVDYLKPVVTYKSDVTLSQTYTSTYLDVIESSNKNGKKMLIMGDSFRFNIVPYFAREAENIMSAHRNRIKNQMFIDFVKTLKEGDIIIYPFVERQDKDAFNKAKALADLIISN